RPLRDQLDRKLERSRAIQAQQMATLSPQERRLGMIVYGGILLFVLGSVGWMAFSMTTEKLPPEAIVKLLYPYGFSDGTLNGRRFAGLQSVDIEYIQREPCTEYESDPHCYAYSYTAKNLEDFSGKMLVGINHKGQWQLFNPPKEVMAAVQAKTSQRKRRR
ncbi:MAG: hypothetical protein LBM75_00720, partial [Myxococcales bacterium]|nr:hypothetical protein [Myxococcales bacterium]